MDYLAHVTDELMALVQTERDVREICQLKYRYLRTLDSKDWGGFEECFVPDATGDYNGLVFDCLLYTSPSPRDGLLSRMPSSA